MPPQPRPARSRKTVPPDKVNDRPEDHGLPALTPDTVEQEKGEGIDNVVPTDGYATLPVVGLGGSAGGLPALKAFFGAMAPDCGMAFVVIMHLSPEHESILAEVLQRSTSMPVRQVRDRIKVEPNCVYVIPPAKNLSMADGHLHLSEPARVRPGKHVAVDLFFRTLADTHGPHAAAIVFSGADGDGAIGIKRIKERGGLTIAQDPGEAEMDSMPRSTIATGMVDWVLPAAEIPTRLCQYWNTERRLRLPPERGPQPAREQTRPPAEQADGMEAALHDILGFLRARTGRDFTYYKRATILRRIARRMQVNGLEEPQTYLSFLRTHPGETGALLQDLLISVTNFFRDREAFAALEATIPALFHGKGPNDTVRVWSAACATGEEAYSVAMLLSEHAGTLDHPPKIQVFATDLDENAIGQARDGTYPETISADVSEERLRRFFAKGHGNYRVKREVREIVLFALHDLLKDSPFSKLDLITCRNLLIYLNRDAQERAMEIFHFSLHPEGVLFLGSSESVEEGSALFAVTDKKHRLYARRTVARPRLPTVFTGPSAQTQALLRHHKEAPVLPKAGLADLHRPPAPTLPEGTPGVPGGGQASWGEVHAQSIEEFGPPSMIVNQEHELVHLSGDAGRFLRFSHGETTTNLLRVIHPMLRIELRAALFRATQSGETTETRGVPVEIEGEHRAVDVRIVPSLPRAPGFLLVILAERDRVAIETGRVSGGEADPAIRELEREVESLKARLRDTVEQSDASQEELKASNEELQAMNEELRSTSEELETGREELQSINEELSTVNGEMRSKVEELGRSNGDLQNLMAATQIPTVFLDRDLCIQRYTPPAVALFNLIPTDVGRPLEDLTTRLRYPNLAADAARVLENLSVAELEVAHTDDRVFLARLRPYRTEEDRIAGVVLTFVDITERRRSEEALRESEARLRTVFESAADFALITLDAQGRITAWNPGAEMIFSSKAAEILGRHAEQLFTPEDRAAGVPAQELQQARETGHAGDDRWMQRHGGDRFWASGSVVPLRTEGQSPHGFLKILRDLTDVHAAEQARRVAEDRFTLVVQGVEDYAIYMLDPKGSVTTWNKGAEQIKGYAPEEIIGQSFAVCFTPEDRAAGKPQDALAIAAAEGRYQSENWRLRKSGERYWGEEVIVPLRGEDGGLIAFAKFCRDLSERKAAEDERTRLLAAERAARAEAEAASKAKDHFLAVLSHELRTPLMPVMMAIHLLRRDRKLSATARDALDMIERNVQIESHFIDDLLDLTKIARGKLEIIREPMDLHQAVQHAVEVTTSDIEGKKQQITVALNAKKHRLSGDATRLQQLFWNLLRNASKFTPEGGTIHVASRNAPGVVIVEVSDTGIGFESDVADRIFEAFEQANVEVTRKFGGLGLGLAISKATVHAHGGSLHAQSKGSNQGATFTVELPLSK